MCESIQNLIVCDNYLLLLVITVFYVNLSNSYRDRLEKKTYNERR